MIACLKSISHRISFVSSIVGYISGVLFGSIILLVLAEVLARSIFSKSLLITTEMSGWLMVGAGFTAFAYALKTGAHIRVTLLFSRLPQRVQTLLGIPLSVIGFLWTIYYAVYFFQEMVFAYARDMRGMSIIRPPLFILWLVAFIGLCFFALQFIGNLCETIITLKENKEKSYKSLDKWRKI